MCTDSAGTATSDILIENDRVRVTRWSFAGRGDNTGWHRHAHDYVVVPEFDGNLEVLLPGGETVIAPQTNGTPYFREIGGEHDVINGNDYAISFIEIEMLDRKG